MRRVQNISFDVAVTASSEKAVCGKAGIKVLSIELGIDGTKAVSYEQVTRLIAMKRVRVIISIIDT
jgi:hypothetical protein